MAIEETRKKIHFTDFEITKGRPVDLSPPPTITIDAGGLRFSKALIVETALNGKFVSFAYDPIKNIVGWKVKAEVNLAVVNKQWKLVKQNETNGNWTSSIRQMLNAIDPTGKMSTKKYSKLPVQKYVEANGMDKGTVYYFVDLNEEIGPKKTTAELAAKQEDYEL